MDQETNAGFDSMTSLGHLCPDNGQKRIKVKEYDRAGQSKWATYDTDNYTTHEVKCYHVSCKSYLPESYYDSNEVLAGIALYLKDGKTDWYCNGVHCKIGYIIVKRSNEIQHLHSSHGQIHGKVYKSVFGEEPKNVVASGFAYTPQDGWKWRSGAFNANTTGAMNGSFHTKVGDFTVDKKMGPLEIQAIQRALKNSIQNKTQNTRLKIPLVLYAKKQPPDAGCTVL